ncbi:MAG: hypothetical protein L0212_08290 [Acidobacteria bacterium]|nr:hypothetical protein [Acidobacteriota bacterium]
MTRTEKLENARLLLAEADEIRRHGLTNFFAHTYACARYGQTGKDYPEERCGNCPIRPFVPADYLEEAFPCQHITGQGWQQAAERAGLADAYVAWLLKTAAELEAEAFPASS